MKSEKHTGDVFPSSVKLWNPTPLIQQYFQENNGRLQDILLQGRDPRPGDPVTRLIASLLFIHIVVYSIPLLSHVP